MEEQVLVNQTHKPQSVVDGGKMFMNQARKPQSVGDGATGVGESNI